MRPRLSNPVPSCGSGAQVKRAPGGDKAKAERCPRGPAWPGALRSLVGGALTQESHSSLRSVSSLCGNRQETIHDTGHRRRKQHGKYSSDGNIFCAGKTETWPNAGRLCAGLVTGLLHPEGVRGLRRGVRRGTRSRRPTGRRPRLVVQPQLCSYRASPAGVEEGVADLLICCFRFCLQTGLAGTAWLADGIGVMPEKFAPRQRWLVLAAAGPGSPHATPHRGWGAASPPWPPGFLWGGGGPSSGPRERGGGGWALPPSPCGHLGLTSPRSCVGMRTEPDDARPPAFLQK